MQFVNRLTEDRIQLRNGTLYTMLGRLVKDGIIEIVSEEKGKKTYQITKDGISLMLREVKRLRYQLENGIEVFGQELLEELICCEPCYKIYVVHRHIFHSHHLIHKAS